MPYCRPRESGNDGQGVNFSEFIQSGSKSAAEARMRPAFKNQSELGSGFSKRVVVLPETLSRSSAPFPGR
jgi:hypothetical protein